MLNFAVPFWVFPAAATLAVWLWAFLMPMRGPQNVMDFGPALSGFFRLIVGVFVTMAAWLIYFLVF